MYDRRQLKEEARYAHHHVFQPPAPQAGEAPPGRCGGVRPQALWRGVHQPHHPGGGDPRGSFYQYFADKTDLFRYVLQTYGCQVLELASTSLDACGGRLLELPLTMFDRTLERYRADNGAFQNLLGIVRQNVGMDVSQFLNFPRAQQVLLARIDPAGLSFRSREELEVLLKMLVLLTAHALMAVCCGEDSPENTRRLLDRAVEIIRRGAESKEEPVC